MTRSHGRTSQTMTVLDPFAYWSRALTAWQLMATTAGKAASTLTASQDVVQAREEIIRSAVLSPLTADYPEIMRMMTEKVAAFSASGNVVAQAWSTACDEWSALAADTSATFRPGSIPTPMVVGEFWTRVSLRMLRTLEQGSRVGRDSLAPIHRTATANARRLARPASR